MDKETTSLIKWIRDGLEAVGRRQIDLARHLGIPPSRMSEVMHGRRRLTAIELQQVARFLGRSPPGQPQTQTQRGMPIVGVIGSNGPTFRRRKTLA